jgi:hypothetical protein
VKCDESGASGESDTMKKVSYEECLALRQKELKLLEDQGSVIGGGEGGLKGLEVAAPTSTASSSVGARFWKGLEAMSLSLLGKRATMAEL